MRIPSKRSFSDVYTTVLRQHAEIRSLVSGLDAGNVVASPVTDAALRLSLLRLAAIFDAHLTFEERELAPRIRAIDAWGPEREAALLAEHLEQRKMLQKVCASIESEPPVTPLELAAEASRLVVTILDDIAREERELDELQRLDRLAGEQLTG